VCLNGHLRPGEVDPREARGAPTNRADPLAVPTGVPCSTCGAGTIVACPCCGYPIPAPITGRATDVPHFCVVCGEYYPWTFLGEFYATLAEILEESPRLSAGPRHAALAALERQRQGLADRPEVAALSATFRSLGGSDRDLAEQILAVVLPAAEAHGTGDTVRTGG
jgi:hypothetical protein